MLVDTENIYIEPSAAAGFPGPIWLISSTEGREYIESMNLSNKWIMLPILYTTGGNMVPDTIMMSYYHKGKSIR